MKVAYIRVSTHNIEQQSSIASQIEELKSLGAEKFFIDELSGKNTNRPQLKAMLDYVRENDSVLIRDFSRLARSTKDLLEIVEYLENKNVALVSHRESIDTSTPSGKLILTILASIAQFERENTIEKIRIGCAIAKEKGHYKGRQEKKINETLFNSLFEKYQKREINKTELAKQLNVSRPKLDKILKEKGLMAAWYQSSGQRAAAFYLRLYWKVNIKLNYNLVRV